MRTIKFNDGLILKFYDSDLNYQIKKGVLYVGYDEDLTAENSVFCFSMDKITAIVDHTYNNWDIITPPNYEGRGFI